jgi:hypothetical protein
MILGKKITLPELKKEITQHHAMMKPAKDVMAAIGSLPGPVKRFFSNEKNAFWFTMEDLQPFIDANVPYMVVVLGAHFSGQTGYEEGSATTILIGTDALPFLEKNGMLRVKPTGPFREYPTQGYVQQVQSTKTNKQITKKRKNTGQ